MNKKNMDLRQLVMLLKKRLLIILVSTLLLGAGAYFYSSSFVTPLYTATVKMYVYNDAERSGMMTTSELNAAKSLVDTYIVIIRSDTVLDRVAESLGLDTGTEHLGSILSAGSIDSTEAFSVSITHSDPALAQSIVNEIAAIAPEEIIRVVKAGSVEVIDYAKLPEFPVSPNIATNTLAGALAGFVLSFGGVVIYELFDTKIRDEGDLTREFDIPVLGSVPSLTGNDGIGRVRS